MKQMTQNERFKHFLAGHYGRFHFVVRDYRLCYAMRDKGWRIPNALEYAFHDRAIKNSFFQGEILEVDGELGSLWQPLLDRWKADLADAVVELAE